MWKNNGNTFPEWFDEEAYSIKPATFGWTLEEGDTFDLGNRKFHVYETPGHSPCSISLYDEREKILVSGDLIRCEEYLFLQVPTAVLSDYAPSLRKLEKLAAENEVRWITSGHTDPYPDLLHHRRVGAEHGGSRSGQVRPARQGGRRRVGRGGRVRVPPRQGVDSGSREKVTPNRRDAMDTQGWYEVIEFAPGTYQISEAARWNMFLLVGEEKALSLDGGIGVGSVRRLCESITDLPVEHVLTHTHWDHVGAVA